MFRTKRQRNLTIGVTIVYLIMLIWIVLFKCAIDFTYFEPIRRVNLIPYHTPMITNGRVNYYEIIYNVLVFIPLGVFTGIFWPNWSFVKKIAPSFGVSLLFEISQFLFAIGTSDITDVIGNTFGGLLGILLFMTLDKVFYRKAVTIVNVIASVVTLLIVGSIVLFLVL